MTDFEKELIHYIFHVQDADDDNLSAEVICRKLYKYGLIDRGRGYWRPKKRPKYRWPARAIHKAEQTEPQTNADQHVQHVGSVETMSCQECKRWIYDDRWGWFCPLKSQDECKYEPKDEPQAEREGE